MTPDLPDEILAVLPEPSGMTAERAAALVQKRIA
jgi:hypothetical protein